ncbi:AroM family protein [Mesorhizobium sp. M0029]|uniref:AroM family protein n=1 Tax=Mesorhizobium sp. M0029 TaxID=2956850 RepID=UPI0033368206
MTATSIPRDLSTPRILSARTGQVFAGAPVGILLLDEVICPFIPGSVGNASTWSVPVRYKVVPGMTEHRLFGPTPSDATPAVVQAAIELAREGAQLISANCGFTIHFQEAVRASVDVPVLLSSLLLAPFLERLLPQTKALGIITGDASYFTPELRLAAGISGDSDRFVVASINDAPAWAALWKYPSTIDVAAVESEVVRAALSLVSVRPDVGAILLECSELPPYAAAVQRATGLPVFDFTSMVEFFAGGLTRKPFDGLGH